MTPGAVETPTARISLGGDGVLRVVLHAAETGPSAEANVTAAAALVGDGRCVPGLIDLRRSRSIDRGARLYYGGPVAARVASPVALLVDSPMSRILGNFVLGWNNTEVPLRLFSAEPEALAWLLGPAR